VIDLNKVSP